MLEVIFLFALGLIWIVFASVSDLKRTEVPNWVSISLVIFALGFRLFYCLFSSENIDFSFFYQGLIGLGIFIVLGNLFYYSRVFAGGDAKLMMALGAVLPISNSFMDNVWYFVIFLLIFFIIGTVYGLGWSVYLVIRRFKAFIHEYKVLFNKNKKRLCLSLLLGLIIILLGIYYSLLFYIGALIIIFPLFFIYAKAVDEAAMVRRVNVKDLMEGDWIYQNVKIGKRVILVSWDGLSSRDIKDIQKKHKSILIRHGIVFAPVFLISFIIFAYGILRGISILSSFITILS